jgi:hypothetical protein
MYYLYRHIRLDKNQPFYIGIGTKTKSFSKTYRSEYYRAFSKQRKDSKIWNLIVNKTKYEVEILFESNDCEFIKQKEKEFISLYGRIDLKTGCLANMTDGGDGSLGRVVSQSTINKLKTSRHIRVATKKVRIYQYDLNGNFIREWDSIKEASVYCKVHKSTLQKIAVKEVNNNYCKGYYWSSKFSNKIEPKPYRIATFAKIQMINPVNNEILNTFNSKEEALRFLGKRKSGTHITKSIKNNKSVYGYKWKEVLP